MYAIFETYKGQNIDGSGFYNCCILGAYVILDKFFSDISCCHASYMSTVLLKIKILGGTPKLIWGKMEIMQSSCCH